MEKQISNNGCTLMQQTILIFEAKHTVEFLLLDLVTDFEQFLFK